MLHVEMGNKLFGLWEVPRNMRHRLRQQPNISKQPELDPCTNPEEQMPCNIYEDAPNTSVKIRAISDSGGSKAHKYSRRIPLGSTGTWTVEKRDDTC